MSKSIKATWGLVLAALLTACGGGGGGSDTPGPEPVVAQVAIRETGLLLTAAGASRQLNALVTDALGTPVEAEVSWSSSNPAAIAVDAGGRVTAVAASGSAQITAQVQDLRSTPLLVAVAVPPAGALLLTDEQIVGDPVETDPNAAPSLANTYRVVLTGAAAPAVGQLVINTESKPVAGRVVAVSTSGGRHTVTLMLAPARTLFPNLNLKETFDLSRAQVVFPAELAAKYDIARSGDTFSFTPRQGAFGAADRRARALAASGTHALPPFTSCESSFSTLPIALSMPPLFSVTINPSLDVIFTAANGLERFIFQAEPVFQVEGGITVTAAFEGKVDCKVELFAIRVPVGGALSLVIGAILPVGVGLEAGGKVTVATLGIQSKVQTQTRAQVGLACPSGADCEFVRTLDDLRVEYQPTVDLPGIGDLRVEPTLMAYGWISAEIGNPFLRSIRFEAFTARAGAKLAGSFAPMIGQITDTSYQSDYKVALEAEAKVGADLDGALELLGLEDLAAIELTIGTDLARSPAASVMASQASFAAGDVVRFSVRFDPARKDFFPGVGPYNIDEVLLVRKNGLVAEVVGRASASTGQTDFTIPFNATDFGSASEFSAFVVTKLLPAQVLALELDRPVAIQVGELSADYACVDNPRVCDWHRATVVWVAYTEQVPGIPVGVPDLEVVLTVTGGSECIAASGSDRTDAQGRFTIELWPTGFSTACAQSGGTLRLELRAQDGGVVFKMESPVHLGDT